MPSLELAELLKRIEIPPDRRYISVAEAEGAFMHELIRQRGLQRTLEIGLAHGFSAVCMASAHAGPHCCMDPFQDQMFQNLGLRNLEQMGLRDRVEFFPGFSHDVLPRLLAEHRSFDFAFIDGAHLFDGILLDFYYVDRLLAQGGYVLFHDAWMRSTRLVASFIRRNRRDYQRVKCPLRNLVLFQKVAADSREWHYFKEFYTWQSCVSQPLVIWLMQRGWLSRWVK